MESHSSTLPWSTSDIHQSPSARPIGNFSMESRPLSQPSGHPPGRPSGTIVQVCADVKPRLTKEQHEILERHFQAHPKPSTSTKKGFADALGVPLDKINNWFQNRRAKVKQDHKKQINAIHLFQATLAQHSQQYFTQPPPVQEQLPQYYGPLPVLPSSETPPDSTQASSPSYDIQEHGLPTSAIMQSTVSHERTSAPNQEFEMEVPLMMSAAESMQFAAPTFGMGYNGQFEHLGAPFHFNNTAEYDFAPYAIQMSTGAAQASASASPNTMPSLTSAYSHPDHVDDDKPTLIVDSPQEPLDSSVGTNHTTPSESHSNWPPKLEFYQHSNGSAPFFFDDSDSLAPSVEDNIRRNSSTTMLREAMSSVDIEQSSSDGEINFPKSSPPPSGLAARRQKPRPANLGPACIRSASYSTGMPSPGAGSGVSAQDQALRRIRSHGNTNPGRISKPSGPQKSPMHANFEAAAAAAVASPKFARHAASYSTSTMSSGPLTATSGPGSLAPPTPCTPNDFGRFPNWPVQGGGNMFQSPGLYSVADEGPYHMSPSGQQPLDHQQRDYAANFAVRNVGYLEHTPPQSAPATQQHFGPSTQPHAMMQSYNHHHGHVRRPSLPDAINGPEPQAQWTNAPSHDLQLQYNPMPQVFPPQGMHPHDAAMMSASGMPVSYQCKPGMAFQPVMGPPPYGMYSDAAKQQIAFFNHGPQDFHNGVLNKKS